MAAKKKIAHKKSTVQIVTMTFLTIVVFGPIYWVSMSAFKGPEEIIRQVPTLFPEDPGLANFERLLLATDYSTFLANSVIVATGTMLGTIAVSLLASYGLYRLKVPGGGTLAGIILLSYMIPGTLLIVPLYGTLNDLGLINSHAGLVLVNVAFTAPFCTWLLRGFLRSIPVDMDDAAAIDGAGPLRTMFQIVFPLLAPGVATVAVFSFVYAWKEFVFASQFIISDELSTLPIGLKGIIGQYTVDWGLVMAATVFTLLPSVILFLFIGRFFVRGLMNGATK